MTAQTILTACFGDLNIIAQGETLPAAIAQDGLRRLNNLVLGWRTQFDTTTAVERQVFALTANQQTYTIGPGGDFDVPRPISVVGAGLWLNALAASATVTITRTAAVATVAQTSHGRAVGDEVLIANADQAAYNGLQTVESVPGANTWTFAVEGHPVTPATGTITAAAVSGQPIEIPRFVITDDGYQSIQIKNLPNAQFTYVYYNPTFPLGTVVLWPKPNTAQNQLVLYLQNVFNGFVDLSTDYDFPDLPGYAEALQYNLDLRLAMPYGRSVPPGIADLAAETLGLIKRANLKLTDLPTDAAMLAWNRRGGYNINSGTGG